MAYYSESCSDQFESFLDLDILGGDYCPLFDIHDDVDSSANNFSIDPSIKGDPLDINLQEELEKMLKSDIPDSSMNSDGKFQHDEDVNNTNFELTVKEELDNHESFLNQIMQGDQEKEGFLPKEEDQSSMNIPRPTIKYVRHIQPMPERTSPLPMSNPRKRFFCQSNQVSQIFQTGNLEKEVTFMGRSIVPLNHIKKAPGPGTKGLHLQIPRGKPQGKTRSLLRMTTAEPRLNHLQIFNAKFAHLKVDVAKNVEESPLKIRRGISILKPVSLSSVAVMRSPVQVIKKNEETEELKSPSGWITKEDPTKEKKNEQERNRRGELAMYRDELRKMLPQTHGVEKVATVTVLEMARDYCVALQHQVGSSASWRFI